MVTGVVCACGTLWGRGAVGAAAPASLCADRRPGWSCCCWTAREGSASRDEATLDDWRLAKPMMPTAIISPTPRMAPTMIRVLERGRGTSVPGGSDGCAARSGGVGAPLNWMRPTASKGDGGGDGGGGGGTSAVFDKPYAAPGAPDTSTIASKHPNGTNGPTTIAMAKTTDCLNCHRMGGTAAGAIFLIAGVTKPNAEVGVKLTAGGGKVVTTRATQEGYFYIESGDSIAGAKASVRDSQTNFSDMLGPLGSGACNQPACHGGAQGDVFKGK